MIDEQGQGNVEGPKAFGLDAVAAQPRPERRHQRRRWCQIGGLVCLSSAFSRVTIMPRTLESANHGRHGSPTGRPHTSRSEVVAEGVLGSSPGHADPESLLEVGWFGAVDHLGDAVNHWQLGPDLGRRSVPDHLDQLGETGAVLDQLHDIVTSDPKPLVGHPRNSGTEDGPEFTIDRGPAAEAKLFDFSTIEQAGAAINRHLTVKDPPTDVGIDGLAFHAEEFSDLRRRQPWLVAHLDRPTLVLSIGETLWWSQSDR